MEEKTYSLTTLTEYLNEQFKGKKTGEPFRRNDVQAYIQRGYIPKYLGDVSIIHIKDLPGKIYKLVKN